jgi:hypothetical protein
VTTSNVDATAAVGGDPYKGRIDGNPKTVLVDRQVTVSSNQGWGPIKTQCRRDGALGRFHSYVIAADDEARIVEAVESSVLEADPVNPSPSHLNIDCIVFNEEQ